MYTDTFTLSLTTRQSTHSSGSVFPFVLVLVLKKLGFVWFVNSDRIRLPHAAVFSVVFDVLNLNVYYKRFRGIFVCMAHVEG